MARTKSAEHVRVEETPAYWRVVFENPPFNMVDDTILEGLQDLLVRMDASPNLRVVVFESSNPEFYLAHFDLTGNIGNITTAVGPSGLPILMDTFVRLTKSPVVSIAKIRGCVRGASSEFVLACDMRFASRENTRLGQPEVGVGVNPGGGATERLPQLVGRGRALEIILGSNDFDGDSAEWYGYVNRGILGIRALSTRGLELGVLLLEGVGDVLEEDQPEDDMLVLGGVHAAAQGVGHPP
jgi:enoyl-CoA hydratase/carnithine racemase